MINYNVSVRDNSVVAALEKLRAKVSDLTAVNDEIGNALVNLVKLGFRNSTTPDGARWAPLVFRDGQPLRDTSRLMNSIEHVVTPDGVEVGTNVEYAHVHQTGMTIKPKNGKFLVFTPRGFSHPIFAKQVTVPARPFLPEGDLPTAWGREVLDVIDDYLGAA